MSSELNIFNMAERGVNTTLDPVHLEDGDLTSAQNVQPNPAGAYGSVRKRDGNAKLNSAAMAGQVTGFIGLPLPDLTTRTTYYYYPIDDTSTPTSSTWRTSTDGSVWTTSTTIAAKSQEVADLGTAWSPANWAPKWTTLGSKLYYPGTDYTATGASRTAATIHVYDGTTDYVLAQVPLHPAITASEYHGVLSIVPYSESELIVTTYDGNDATGRGRVFILDVTTGSLVQMGQETTISGGPVAAIVYQGWIFVGTASANGTTGIVYKVRPGDATLTTEATNDAGEQCHAFMTFGGNLYLGTNAGWPDVSNARVARIRKRTASTAAWADSYVSDSTATGNSIGPFILSSDGGTAFAFLHKVSAGAAPLLSIISSTDGTTWATAYDVSTNVGTSYTNSNWPIRATNGDIYWPLYSDAMVARILKRTSAGSWSIVDSSGAKTRGPLLLFKY